jgi:two-component system, NarL family, sensor kinase
MAARKPSKADSPATEAKRVTPTAKLKRRNRELSILNAIAAALNREVDLTDALRTVLAQVAELLDLETGWIWLLREDSGTAYLAAAQNLPPALSDHPQRMEGSCYCLDSFRAGDMARADNIGIITCTRLRWLDPEDGTAGLKYHASIPLYHGDKRLGVLNVASVDWRELSPDDLRLLYTVGDLLTIAIERARLFAHSTRLGAVEERNRLAREIHDTLAQGLAAISLQLETADALLEVNADIERLRRPVRQALTLARANMEEARRSVLDLRAAPLEGRSLAEAIKALIDSVATVSGRSLQRSFEVSGSDQPLPVALEAGLYRIAQEAVANVIQHANAKRLAVRLATTAEQVQLVIEDDGQGFDPAQISTERYGLVGLNERARLLGGSLNLSTDPGAGTRVEVTIPLERK